MALLELEGMSARYGNARAVEDISLSVSESGAVGILGANGAGKTTTLRAISGLVKTSGSIRFDGVEIMGKRPDQVAALGIAHVPEGRGTLKRLTVRENLLIGATRRRDRRAVAKDIDFLLVLFPNLAARISARAATLSGGEQQMLAIARAYMLRPRLMLLDEASLGLAPGTAKRVYAAIRQLRAETGLAMVVVEQNAALAFSIVEDAVVLETGSVALRGTKQQLMGMDEVRRAYLGG